MEATLPQVQEEVLERVQEQELEQILGPLQAIRAVDRRPAFIIRSTTGHRRERERFKF